MPREKPNDGLTIQQRYRSKPKTRQRIREYALKYEKKNPEKIREYAKKYREGHRDYLNELGRNIGKKLRNQILDKFGRKCNNPNCPIPAEKLDIRSLQLDHINDDGAKEKKLLGSCYSIYRKALKYPDNYQLLCPYCNWMKRFKA
jgi:hypothetical protein